VNAVRIQKIKRLENSHLRVDKAHILNELSAQTRGGMEECCKTVIPAVMKAYSDKGITMSSDKTLQYLDFKDAHAALFEIDTKFNEEQHGVELKWLASDGRVRSGGAFMFFKAMCDGWAAEATSTNFLLTPSPQSQAWMKEKFPKITLDREVTMEQLRGYYESLGMKPVPNSNLYKAPYSDLYPKCVSNARIRANGEEKELFEEISVSVGPSSGKLLTVTVNNVEVYNSPDEQKKSFCIIA